jgi:hypothetical protein
MEVTDGPGRDECAWAREVKIEFEDCTEATLVPNRSTHLHQFRPDSLYRSLAIHTPPDSRAAAR